MKNRSIAALALSVFLLAGCSYSGISLLSSSEKKKGVFLASSTRGIVSSVERANLERSLAVLTGKAALPDGTNLTERASADSKKKVRDYLSSALQAAGCKVERQVYKTGENLLGTLPAAEPSTEYVLIGAHFDTVRCAGADDNGSAVSAVLEVARLLSSLPGRKVNLLFAFFDEEERGLLGSAAMAKELKKRNLNVSSVHTLDMVGYDGDGDSTVEIERPDGKLWGYYQMSAKNHGLKTTLSRTNAGSTDHDAFRAAGFVSVGLCEEWTGGDTTPHYHRTSDTFETVNFTYLASVTRLLVAAAGDLSTGVPAPSGARCLPHDLFPGRDHTFLPSFPLALGWASEGNRFFSLRRA